MATHPQSKKFASLSDREKARRIQSGESSGRMSRAEADKARRFWGVASTPPRSSKPAIIFGGEQQLAPWEVRPPPRAAVRPPPRYDPGVTRLPSPAQARRNAQQQRVNQALRVTLDPVARKKLADSLTPQRREALRRADVLPPAPPPRAQRGLTGLGLTDVEREKILGRSFNPLDPIAGAGDYLARQVRNEGQTIGEDLGPLVRGAYDWTFSPEERADNAALLQQGMESTTALSGKISGAINTQLAAESGHLEQAGIPIPDPLKRTAAATVKTGTEALVGTGPGIVSGLVHPLQAAGAMEQQYKDYYGRLLKGDFSVLEEQGVTQPFFDITALGGAAFGAAGRAGALTRTNAFLREGGELRLTSEGKPISAAAARNRAVTLGQEPVRMPDGTVTMGVPPHIREATREAPIRAGETIDEGDKVTVRNADRETYDVTATKENGLVGKEGPNVNDPIRHVVDGEPVDVVAAYKQVPFAQRFVPRSNWGRVVSDFYHRFRQAGTATREGLDLRPGGSGYRARLLRQERETSEDRELGGIRAFRANYKAIQKDTVLSTAYDRMLRYPDPVEGIQQEIAARRQRGGVDENTKQGKQFMAALEQAGEVVKNPPQRLHDAAWAGKMLADDTTQFLVRRGMLNPETAVRSEFAAQRWLKPGHLRDEPLSGQRRSEVEAELRQQYGEDTPLAMAHTDTLARAWGEANGRDPAEWYPTFIKSVERQPAEEIARTAAANRQALRQWRRTPTPGETMAIKEPDGNTVRVARLVGWKNDGDVAEMEWVREPNAGERFEVPAETVMGNTTKIHGWRSGIAIEAEKLGEKVSKQEAHSKLSKAPGVKADEWKWMGMDKILDDLYPPGVKSRSRQEITDAIRAKTFRFETTKLQANEAYFETQHSVTLPGDYVDYHETLIHWPHRIEPSEGAAEPDWEWIQESWGEHVANMKQEALAAGEEWDDADYYEEAPDWYVQAEVEHWRESYQPEEALYEAPHFDDDQGPDRYSDEGGPGYNKNLLGWVRYSTRWVGGRLMRIIEEAQSDWHQKSKGRYRTEEAVAAHKEAQRVAEDAHAKYSAKKSIYQNAFRAAVDKADVPVRVLTTGEEGVVQKGEWGGLPYYQVIRRVDDRSQEGYADQAVIGARNRRDELAGKLREAERGWGDLADEPAVLGLRHELTQATATLREVEAQQRGYHNLDRTTDTNLEPAEDHDLMDKFSEMREAEGQYQDANYIANQRRMDANAHPDAPYKGSAWEELLFREAVRDAVANGETHIAWTTGAQQAERYNSLMASNVNRVEWNGYDLRVRDGSGQWHTFEADTETKLLDYVGSAMAKKLAEQLSEKIPEADPNLVRIERPTGGGHTQSLEDAHLSDAEPGDVVYVGYPDRNSDWPAANVHTLRTRDEGGQTTFWEYDASSSYPLSGHGESMNLMEAQDHVVSYQQKQLEAGLHPRRGPNDAAVLEGEDISIGGGGFIDAYDRRMRNYAKKWFGKYAKDVEPQQVPVDSLSYDVIHASDPRHPGHEQAYAEFKSVYDDVYGREGADAAYEAASHLSQEAGGSLAPLYRVKAGETILAESESLQAALRAAKNGGPDAGIWPPRVRLDEGDESWRIYDRGGQRGGTAPTYERARADAFDTYEEAVAKLEGDKGSYYHDWDSTFDHGGKVSNEPNPGPVWMVEIPEALAAELHERGASLFQRRRGQVYGLAHITDEGADIFLNADDADIATWVEESAHAVIPTWFDDADARGDLRADHIREHIELGPGEPIDGLANERVVRAFQAWLRRGAIGAPQQRQLLHGLSDEMKKAYYKEDAISLTDAGAAEVKRMLDDPVVTSFFRDAFDVAPYKDLDPGTVTFSTMKTRTKVKRTTGEQLQGRIRSINPSRRNLAKQRNTMKAWESGSFDVGPDVTAHYAAAESRIRSQDELALRLKRYEEPIELVDGVPQLKPGYRVYNYHGIRGANSKLDRHFRASNRYGDIPLSESEQPLLSADPAAGGMNMEPVDFLESAEELAASTLGDEMLYKSIGEAQAKVGDTFLEKVQRGLITQIPEDAAHAFESASGASFSLGAVSNMTRALSAVLAIPTMKARWMMVGKFAYPILNALQTGILIGINQGPALAFSVRAAFDLTAATRFRLMSEVGLGMADVATHTPELYGIAERLRRGEQTAFRRVMTLLSQPEARVRMLQMVNDLRRAGYRGEKDVVALLDRVKAGDEASTKVLNQISRQAEDAVVRFRGLSPEEQFIVRDAIFVYGWLRAATRFTLQFPLNRPVTSAALFNVGQYGWQKLQDDFFPMAREQDGALPLGQRKMLDGFARKIVDVNNLLPFSTAKSVMDPIITMMGLEDGGNRPAAIADMLAASVEFGLTGVYGKDPRYGSTIWDQIVRDYSPAQLPGITWAWRLADPASSGTKLRVPYDRSGVAVNLFLGMMAPQEIRESVSYKRWLDQQPTVLRTVIREQNTAATFSQLAQTAAQVDGEEPDVESLRAINAATAYNVYADLYKHKHGSISALERSGVKAEIIKHYYPDSYGEGALDTEGTNFSDPDSAADYMTTWDDLFDETVSQVNKATRQHVKDTLGRDVPSTEDQPHSLDEITNSWLRTAPQDSLDRLRKRIGPGTSDAQARDYILQEMQGASAP